MTRIPRFKEIDIHMKEYWKTHTIIPPYKDDPLYVVGRIEESLTMDNFYKRCYICNKEYNDYDIKPLNIKKDNIVGAISQIEYKGQVIPLCNACMRTLALYEAIKSGYDLIY